MKKGKVIGGIVLLAILAWIYLNFAKIPNRSDLPGGFEEVAFVRNENNLGTVLLYYAFTVKDTTIANYEALGKTLPFNKTSGVTTAFFFHGSAPDKLTLEAPHYDTTRFRPVRVYTIDKVGNRTLTSGLGQ